MEEEKDDVDWDSIEKDDVDFIYDNAKELANSIRTLSDRHTSRAVFFLTGLIILIAAMIPEIITEMQKIKMIMKESDINTGEVIFAFLFIVCFGFSFLYIISAMHLFYKILGMDNDNSIFPYLSPEKILDNELYKKDKKESIKAKIRTIKLLKENIIPKNYKNADAKDDLLVKGRKQLLYGVITGFFSFISYLLIPFM